jgi:hypothetical protein
MFGKRTEKALKSKFRRILEGIDKYEISAELYSMVRHLCDNHKNNY